jgi:putative tricarboxylic transport membrane protein
MARLLTPDRIIGVILLIFSCLFTWAAFDLEKTIPPFFRNQPMRLDTLPRILGVFSIIASVITIISPTTGAKRVSDNKQLKESEDRMADLSFETFGQAKWGQLCAMIALMFVYASVLRMGGFIPTTFFLLLFGSILLGERRWIAMVIVSLAAPLAIWLLVTYVLQRTIVPLPKPLMNLIGG